MIKNFIFDIDGTLLDTEKMYMLSLQDVLNKRGINRDYTELVATFGIPGDDALKILKIPENLIPDILEEWANRIPAHQDEVHLFSGIEEMLSKLSQRPNTELAIMTSKRKFEFDRDIVPLGIDKYFSKFVFFDDTKRGKPAPDPIILAVKRLDAKFDETIYIGDTLYDMQAAHAANVAFGLVTWGNNPHAKMAGAEFKIDDPTELLTL